MRRVPGRSGEEVSHEAYTSFTKSLQSEWRFLQRLIPGSSPCLKELDDVIARVFIPALVGRRVSDLEKRLFALPTRFAGLGILVSPPSRLKPPIMVCLLLLLQW